MKVVRTLLFVILALYWSMQPSFAAKKALLIGINEYSHLEDLQKSVGDAEAIGAALKGIGFEVTVERNLDRHSFNAVLIKFKNTLAPGDVALFHFSGHGVTNGTDNLLLPSDIRSSDEMTPEVVASDALSIRFIDDMLSSVGTATNILIVDACRNNPFERQGLKSVGMDRGLSPTEPESGTFIMYAAGTRERALDRLSDSDAEGTSVYTRVLLKHLTTPGEAIGDIAQDVRTEVASLAKSVKHKQSPAYHDGLRERFYLVPKTEPTEEVLAASVSKENDVADLSASASVASAPFKLAKQVVASVIPPETSAAKDQAEVLDAVAPDVAIPDEPFLRQGYPVPKPRLKPVEIMLSAAANIKNAHNLSASELFEDSSAMSVPKGNQEGKGDQLVVNSCSKGNLGEGPRACKTVGVNEAPTLLPVVDGSDVNWWAQLFSNEEERIREGATNPTVKIDEPAAALNMSDSSAGPLPLPPPPEGWKASNDLTAVKTNGSEKGLKLCNSTQNRINAAIAYKHVDNGFGSEGWWTVEPNKCLSVINEELKARYYYIYAADTDKGGSWGGKLQACIKVKDFKINGVVNCEKQGFKSEGFFEVDTGEQSSWTVSISDNKK